ncbi:lactate utilization protein C [Plantactinospora solaniradicis]|uniref:Lactate utilization protein C n=1 Tax=Plantactinospora solaniradicis TaxID=1723736 RepID=A0ABW1KLF5_9ACTN
MTKASHGSARDEVLARIRAARPTEPVPVPREYRTAPVTGTRDDAQSGRDRVELLIDRLVDYRATVRRCEPDGVADALAELLGEVPTVVVPEGVPAGWLSTYPGGIRRDGDPDPLTVADLDAPGLAVLTGCAVAIAETGTLILDGGPDQGRRLLTLVPDHHVCVVRTDQVAGGLPEALARLADPTRPLTLVSGPSATSDIELDRVEGVHGPRRLEVLIVGG